MPDGETAARAVTGFEAEIASLDGNGVNAIRGADGRLTSTIVDHLADEVIARAGLRASVLPPHRRTTGPGDNHGRGDEGTWQR